MLLHLHQLSLEEQIQKLNARRRKLLQWIASELSPPDFISVSFSPAYSWEGSPVNFQASTESEMNHQGMSICSFPWVSCSPCSLWQPLENIFCCSCLTLTDFFFTSLTIKASGSCAGCFRHHTKSNGLSKARVANTGCRKERKKYDCFIGNLYWHCNTI